MRPLIPHKTVWAATVLAALLLAAGLGHAQTVTKAAGGANHSLFLKSDGSLWATGWNEYGQLGDGTTNNVNRPKQIVANGVTDISCGEGYSLFIKSDGSLWGMGALALQVAPNPVSPIQIVASGVTAIAGGVYHSLFIKSDGSLWGWGFNGFGQLGDGTYTDRLSPVQIVASGVKAIACGERHSIFLKSDGSLWAMGYNHDGQLGDGIFATNSPFGINQPELIISIGVTAIASGIDHNIFLKSDGSLWAMGNDYLGELGDGTNNNVNRPELIVSNGVTTIACGQTYSLFLKSDGSLWGMGNNFAGQLGDGTRNNTNQPEQIIASRVTAIAHSYHQAFFLKNDASLWGMGLNRYGQLGDGTFNNTNRPELIVAGVSVTNLTAGGGGFANQQFRFTLTGPAGSNAVITASTNLLTWTPLVTNPLGSGSLSFTDAVSTNFPRRFYRAALTP